MTGSASRSKTKGRVSGAARSYGPSYSRSSRSGKKAASARSRTSAAGKSAGYRRSASGASSGRSGSAYGSNYKRGSEYDRPSRNKNGKSRALKAIPFIILLAAVSFLAVIYFMQVRFYKDHFLKGTMFNTVDCSNLTVAEAKKKIKKKIDEYTLTLTFADGSNAVLSSDMLNAQEVSAETLQKVMDDQDELMWMDQYFASPVEAADTLSINSEELTKALSAVPQLQAENMVAPTDASVVFEDGAYKVQPETEGNTIDVSKVIPVVEEAVLNRTEEIDVASIEGAYAKPTVLSTDENLNNQVTQLNDLTKGSVTYDLPTGKKVLDRQTLVTWLVDNGDGTYTKDPDVWNQHIRDYVNAMGDEVDTWGKGQNFNATGIGQVFVDWGDSSDYGWKMDRETEIQNLTNDLESGNVTEREPAWTYKTTTGASMDQNSGMGGTYVEVDLSRQHLWLYKDNSLLIDFDIVSGEMSSRHYTPEGLYYINSNKQNGTTLKGPSREIKIETYPNGKVVRDGEVIQEGTPEPAEGDTGTEGENAEGQEGDQSDQAAGAGEPTVTYETEYEWESDVSYWLPFIGNQIGLHDASWRGAFGGQIYIWSGSHGCVNMPVKYAKTVYENVDVGTPVVVYYSSDYTLHESQ